VGLFFWLRWLVLGSGGAVGVGREFWNRLNRVVCLFMMFTVVWLVSSLLSDYW
jgi:hypothetical protein